MDNVFEQKYTECEKSLYLIAFGYLHNTEDAKDCVQEAALTAFRAYDRLKNKDLFKTWITRILINKVKDFIKKRKFTEEFTDNLGLFCNVPEEEIDILNAVLRLEPDAARYIMLRFYADMTYDEVAMTLKEPASTVKYRTKNALIELKKILEGDL